MTKLIKDEVLKVAILANLPISEENIDKLKRELEASFEYINKIQSLDTSNVLETSQVTGLENVFRDDIVDPSRSLSKDEALANAKSTYKGYFKVRAIFDEE